MKLSKLATSFRNYLDARCQVTVDWAFDPHAIVASSSTSMYAVCPGTRVSLT